MWSWHPKPWQHILDGGLMFGAATVTYIVPDYMRHDWSTSVLAASIAVAGMASWVFADFVIADDKRRENARIIRMDEQPTEEEKHMERKFIRDEVTKVVVTSGNVQTAIDKAPETVRKVPAAFAQYQNTAQAVSLSEVDNAIKKICRRNVTLIEHPDLGFPDGDFRYDTWVRTNEMTNNILLLSLAILEKHGGIERKGSAKNSTWIKRDLDVIKRGARTRLEHPIGCWCDGCKERG
jgi:hypothetical protein